MAPAKKRSTAKKTAAKKSTAKRSTARKPAAKKASPVVQEAPSGPSTQRARHVLDHRP